LKQRTNEEIANEVHADLLKTWAASQLNNFFMGPYAGESLIQYHTTLRRYIRNQYELWRRGPHKPQYDDVGVDHSPYHPDQISQTIIKMIWEKGPKKDE